MKNRPTNAAILLVIYHRDGTKERWYNFPAEDRAEHSRIIAGMERRLIEKRPDYQRAIFYDNKLNTEIKRL